MFYIFYYVDNSIGTGRKEFQSGLVIQDLRATKERQFHRQTNGAFEENPKHLCGPSKSNGTTKDRVYHLLQEVPRQL